MNRILVTSKALIEEGTKGKVPIFYPLSVLSIIVSLNIISVFIYKRIF